MKILVVDDDDLVLSSCQRVLTGDGFEVLLADSVEKALQIIEATDLVLLLIDIKMPVHDGLYLMKQLKERSSRLPVIVMSGYATEETMAAAAKMGSAVFIPKPFTPDELLKTIRSVLYETQK